MPIDTSEAAQAYGRDLLTGERVRLRALEDADVPALERWSADPRVQPLQQAVVLPRPEGGGSAPIRDWGANTASDSVGFAIADRSDGALLGFVGLRGAALPVRAARLAIGLDPDATGRGLGTDAVRVMVRYGFLAMGLNRIDLEVFAYNTRAIRAYERAGFRTEVVRREALYADGGFADELVMALLRREWTP